MQMRAGRRVFTAFFRREKWNGCRTRPAARSAPTQDVWSNDAAKLRDRMLIWWRA
ncbi:hypothetical protein BDY21DRAFT_348734 [Lineolata rhizophorae]|uniref:Uncharacterized protein n=1 Tax=Lineolata rhizophorae TaxID=578093 RepID=A0A6A6NW55_9PEZI|nr:hypothetical protein BDY21DRAFT_348734 [Lineolata rhizophorae]